MTINCTLKLHQMQNSSKLWKCLSFITPDVVEYPRHTQTHKTPKLPLNVWRGEEETWGDNQFKRLNNELAGWSMQTCESVCILLQAGGERKRPELAGINNPQITPASDTGVEWGREEKSAGNYCTARIINDLINVYWGETCSGPDSRGKPPGNCPSLGQWVRHRQTKCSAHLQGGFHSPGILQARLEIGVVKL